MLRNILAQQLDELKQSGYLESVGTEKEIYDSRDRRARARKACRV